IQEKHVEINTRVVQDKKLAISNASLVLKDVDPPFYEPLLFKEVPRSKMLLLFLSKNEEKVFKPGIHTFEKDTIFDLEGGNVLPEKLLDLDSTKDLHPLLHVNPLSGSTTYSSSPLLEEFADELALITFPLKYDDDLQFDVESDLKEIEFMLHQDIESSLKDLIDQSNLANLNDNFLDSMSEMFTDEHAFDYSSPLIFDEYDDDFLEVESDAENVYDDPFDFKGEKIKESKFLIDELDLPCILIQEKHVEINTRVVQDKKLAISNASLVLKYVDPPFYEPLLFKEVPRSKMLLLFLSENEEKVFKPGIHTFEKTFGGNEATKKTKKNQLKQQYGNFKAEGLETLEQTFNRLQAIVSHLEFMDVEIKQDDLNQKFLTSLAPKWLMYTIVWRNRSDLDSMSLDDLYNHFNVYEPEVQKKSKSNSHNMAFISSAKNSSRKEEVNTASISTASTQVSPASANVAATSISHDTACAYIDSQSNGSQIKYKDINQINEDDIKEMDIKWNMALLIMRADRFWKKTGKKITIQEWDWSYMASEEENHDLVADEEAPTEFALMAKSSSKNKVEA
nr:hypothetical protein [Tanacetum cinerariifolium]